MKKILFFLIVPCFVMCSCTLEKTDYEASLSPGVIEHEEFKEAYAIHADRFRISVEALNGTLYKGYNEVRLKVYRNQTNEEVQASNVTFLPILTQANDNPTSGPHRYELLYRESEHYFSGYSVFTQETTAEANWELYISFTISGQTYKVIEKITVQPQVNKNRNMTSFTGVDDEQYIIALVAPQKPSVGENALVAGIYQYHRPTSPSANPFPDSAQFSYSEVSNYKLLLDPRMPEPSMGNHSSPNNKDLLPQEDGLYHGIVNYTMTGNWTLNFRLLNQQEQLIKGTVVPTDFTPGVQGAKSDLFIDILF